MTPVDQALTSFCGKPYDHARLLAIWDRLGFPREKLGRGNNGNQRMTAGILLQGMIDRGELTLDDLHL
jgi:hypothetical protein